MKPELVLEKLAKFSEKEIERAEQEVQSFMKKFLDHGLYYAVSWGMDTALVCEQFLKHTSEGKLSDPEWFRNGNPNLEEDDPNHDPEYRLIQVAIVADWRKNDYLNQLTRWNLNTRKNIEKIDLVVRQRMYQYYHEQLEIIRSCGYVLSDGELVIGDGYIPYEEE